MNHVSACLSGNLLSSRLRQALHTVALTVRFGGYQSALLVFSVHVDADAYDDAFVIGPRSAFTCSKLAVKVLPLASVDQSVQTVGLVVVRPGRIHTRNIGHHVAAQSLDTVVITRIDAIGGSGQQLELGKRTNVPDAI